MVTGFVQSTFSLVYFVEESGSPSMIQLLMGMKQKGVLKSTNDSMLYYFEVSSDYPEELEVRMHSENGHFQVFLGFDYVPSP